MDKGNSTGEIRITHESDSLKAAFKGKSLQLRHFHHNVFDWLSSRSDSLPLKLTFQTDALGRINSLELPLEPNVAPLVFTRQAGNPGCFADPYVIDGSDVTGSNTQDYCNL